jgi:urease accessory protein
MIDPFKFFKSAPFGKILRVRLLSFLAIIMSLLIATPAMAHHAMAGKMPSTFMEGFFSGLAHPLIGVDHFAFIVASGLLAAAKPQGMLIPIAFIASTMLGTGLHYVGINVPGVELLVSGTILVFGILLTQKSTLQTTTVAGLSVLAGICHGYAYGEAIFGAQTTSLLAYLLGFTSIQLGVATIAFIVGKHCIKRPGQPPISALRSAGFVICGVGMAFLFTQVLDVLLPLPTP